MAMAMDILAVENRAVLGKEEIMHMGTEGVLEEGEGRDRLSNSHK